MVDICKDNNPTQTNRENAGLQTNFTSTYRNSVKDNGEYTLGILSSFDSQFIENAVYANFDIIKKMKTEYTDQAFFNGLASVNILLQTAEIPETEYPLLTNRINQGVLFTPIEYANFINEYAYSPIALETNISSNQKSVLDQLESFFENVFSATGIDSFCSLLPSIFAFDKTFFNQIGSIAAKINDAIEFIQNSTFEDALKKVTMTLLISQLKEKTLEVFEKALKNAKNIVNNFTIENIFGLTETFINPNVMKRAHQLKSVAERFFNPDNIELIKKNITDLIDYATSLFKDPSLDTIEFLAYRFCSLAGQIEEGLKSVYTPLTDFSSKYNSSIKTIQASSNQNTGRALRAGAIRYEPEIKKNEINTSRERVTSAGNPPPELPGELDDVTQYNNGRGDSRIGFQGGWVSAVGEEGWTRSDLKVKVLLMRLQKRFGKRLIVNSAYRPPWYNKRVGGAKNSYHMKGNALDITWDGISVSEREEFIRLSREIGFRGIGRYGTRFVHIDLGPVRSWGS